MTPEQEDRVATISREPIALSPVKSSQITAIGHDPETNTLAIQFKPKPGFATGPTYHYGGVDSKLFQRFQKAESVGSFFYKTIKPNVESFPYLKVGDGERIDTVERAA